MWENVTFRVTYCHMIYNHLLVDLHTANIPPSETCLDIFGKLFELLLFASVSHERGCSHYIPESTCLIAFTSANRNPRLIVTLFLAACLFTRSHNIWFGTNLIPDSLLDATLPGTCVSSQYWTSDPSCLTQTLWSYWTLLISPHH